MRVTSLLDLLGIVSIATNEATTIEEAAQACIDAICKFTGWPVGHLYLLDDTPESGEPTLYPTTVWHIRNQRRFAAFRRQTEATPMQAGTGLPGMVLEAGAPIWRMAAEEEIPRPRTQVANEAGIRSAFAFPILAGQQTAGVLEFFSTADVKPDPELLRVMGNVGAQLGRVVERIRAREALRSSEMRFRSVAQSAGDAIISATSDGLITFWNRCAQSMFGYTEEYAIGKPITLLIPERHFPELGSRLAQAQREGSTYVDSTIEISAVRSNGTEFPVEISLASWTIEGETLYSGIIRDISERKSVEQALRNSESRYRLVVEQASDGIIIFDRDANFIDANPHALELIGYAIEDLRQLNLRDTVLKDELAENPVHTWEVERGTVVNNERTMVRKDGSLVRVESTTKMLEDGRILAMVRDVTERKRAEEAIRSLNQELEQRVRERTAELEDAVQVRDEMLQVVSHDLRNPLAGIVGNVRFLYNQLNPERTLDPQKLREILIRIGGATTKMQRLIDELLDFGRLQSGKELTLQLRSVDLVSLAAAAVEQYRYTSGAHRIVLNTTVDKVVGHWDSGRIERVLDNLLSNAIKYSPRGGEVAVSVGKAERNGREHAKLTIRDQGVGIAAEEIEHIFEWFRRGPKHSGRISGAGIGLATSRQITKQHGGSLDVASREGVGSTFTLWLPLRPPDEVSSEAG